MYICRKCGGVLGVYTWPTKMNSVEIKAILIKKVIMYKIIQTFHSLLLLGLTKKPLDIMQPCFIAREYPALRPQVNLQPLIQNYLV
jgi:hypothetical protein